MLDPSHLQLNVPSCEFDQQKLLRLNRILQSYPGRDGVVLLVTQSDGRRFRCGVAGHGRLGLAGHAKCELQDLFGRGALIA